MSADLILGICLDANFHLSVRSGGCLSAFGSFLHV